METNEQLIEHLEKSGVLKTLEIIEAFQQADRRWFVPEAFSRNSYIDEPLPIGQGQTISQPYTVAFMLELLQAQKGDEVLDVGFGSGWTTALLSNIVGDKGKVFALEINKEVFKFGKGNLEKHSFSNVELFNQSGFDGLPESAPFKRILVSAAAEQAPKALKGQLAIGGRLVIPVEHTIEMIEKISQDKFKKEMFFGFSFVPLVG